MFQTLKAQNGALGDLEYVIQSSVPASDMLKAIRKQPACTRCKMKKLKCILEADSCEKCLESGVTCFYRGTREPESGSSTLTASSAESGTKRNATTTTSDCITVNSKGAPCDESPQSSAFHGDSGTSSSSDDSEMETCMTANHSDDTRSAFIDPSIGTPSFIASLNAGTPSLTQEMHAGSLSCSFDTTLHGDELHEFNLCFCTDQIIAANATMQVKLVWATSLAGCSTSSIDDVLQCQKIALASCETFFECKKCILKPDYVVLVISMCQELVNGVKSLKVITSPEALSSPRSHPNPVAPSKRKLEAGGWRLEDDDEIEIIRHLIQVRITKLKKLVGQLEQAVSANHTSYAWMVGNLRKSLDEKFGSATPHTDSTIDLIHIEI